MVKSLKIARIGALSIAVFLAPADWSGTMGHAQVKIGLGKNGSSATAKRPPSDFVKIGITLSDDTLAPGSSAAISILFDPDTGYHVNAKPAVRLDLDSGSVATLKDSIAYRRAGSTDYLDASRALTQRFSLAQKTPGGRAQLTGTLTYYFCSDVEGWCIRQKHPFSLPVVVRAVR